jgi:lysyl-tRNA synthetase class 2
MRQRLIQRAAAFAAVRDYFARADVLEVDTPALVPSPGLDLHLDAFEVKKRNDAPSRYLITSPEYQMKRLLAEGFEAIYQISRCFRRAERGRWHNPEFVMVEWYRSGFDYRDMMTDTEHLVRHVANALGGNLQVDGRTIAHDEAFARITLSEAFAQFASIDEATMLTMATEDEDAFFLILVDKIEPGLAAIDHPIFVYDYPASQASLARLKPSDRRFCERFELYVGGIELCNGFGELVDATEQRTRLVKDATRRAAEGKPNYPIDERFIAALERGIAPCAGNALGFDRLVALCVGADSIAEIMTFSDDRL